MIPKKLTAKDSRKLTKNLFQRKLLTETNMFFYYEWGELHVMFMYEHIWEVIPDSDIEHFWTYKVSEQDKIDSSIMFNIRLHSYIHSKFYPVLHNTNIFEILPSTVKGVKALCMTTEIKDLEALRREYVLSPRYMYMNPELGERYDMIASIIGTHDIQKGVMVQSKLPGK